MGTLASLIQDTRRLLHDANSTYYNDVDLTAWINRAKRRRDIDTGMNRAEATLATVAGQRAYSMAGLSPLYPDGTPAGGTIYDVMNVVLIWANSRYLPGKVPYTDLATFYQPYAGYTNVPSVYCVYGAKSVMLAPAPNQAYPMIWDCVMLSPDLATPSDPDPLPDPWGDPIPFMAAAFAKDESQQSDDAMKFRQHYAEALMMVSGGRIRMLSRPYQNIVGLG